MLALLWRLGEIKRKHKRHTPGMPTALLACPVCLGRKCPHCEGKQWVIMEDPADLIATWASDVVDLWLLCGQDRATHWPGAGGVLDQSAWWLEAKLYLDAIYRMKQRDAHAKRGQGKS